MPDCVPHACVCVLCSIFLLYISNYRWLGRGPSRSRAQQLCPRIEEEQEGDFFTSAQRKRKQARSWGLAGGVVGPDYASSSQCSLTQNVNFRSSFLKASWPPWTDHPLYATPPCQRLSSKRPPARRPLRCDGEVALELQRRCRARDGVRGRRLIPAPASPQPD